MVCQGHQRRKSFRLFSRTGLQQKSPSPIPINLEINEAPEIPVENDLPEDVVESSIEPSPESADLESPDFTALATAEISGEEAEWDPLATEEIEIEEVLEDLTTDSSSLTSEQPAANSQEEETSEETTEITIETSSETEISDPEESSVLENESIDPIAESELEETTIDPVAESELEEEAIVAEVDDTDADTESEETTDEETEDEDAEDTLIDIPLLLSDVVGGLGTVTDPSGQLSVIWKYDGGAYEGQVGVVSTAGLENYDLNSIEFMQEAIRRALDNIVVDDTTKGAEFGGWMNGEDSNHGEFAGVQTVQLSVGEQFFLALIPNGTFADVLASLETGEIPTGDIRPLFSLATANPKDMEHFVQLVDLTGKGSIFALEDIRGDEKSDWDLNDIVITLKGAEVDAAQLDDLLEAGVITEAPKWMETDLGITMLESAIDDLWIEPEDLVTEKYEFPKEDQPLIGFIDTHLTTGNPDINYSNISFGKDWIENDSNPTVVAGEGTHADHILGIVAATQDNGLGIDGINDDAPLWVSSAVESGKWADALVEFVDAAIASNQPNAIINLSIDLTQVNPDGSVTTRYEFTPQERAAIEYARQNGVLIVAAAGNDGGVMSVLGQASQEFDNIITVGAADGMARAAYSSYGYGLDILAPGGTTANPVISLSGEELGAMAGSSVATAKVTGAASQVWAANPELSYRQVIEILKETATDLNTPGWDAETGTGLLNMAAAVGLARTIIPVDYEIPATLVPPIWIGEGKVIPKERAAAVPMWPSIEPSGFSGSVMATVGVNVRSGPGTSFTRVGGYGYNTNLQFDGWTYGERIDDISLGAPDERWYRIAGTNNWIASALIYGNAPGSTPLPPVQIPVQPGQPQPIVNVPINSSSDNYRKGTVNPFAYNWQGQCTWFAYGRMLETGLLPAGTKQNAWFLGNAESWRRDAERAGLPISSTPTAGARGILVWPPYTKGTLQWGHVAFVEEVYPDGRVRISEANWAGKGISERTLTAAQYAGLSFVRLEDATPNPQFDSPQAIPGQQREYRVRSGDTLSAIAQRELGNANRWTEIKKADGSTFTAAEARNLQVGQSVYLPVNYQTGTGNPIVSPPSSTPINSDIRWANFSGTVGPAIGVNLRNSTRFSDRSSRSEPNGKTLEFDAWTYGETGTDMWTGQPDARWFKVKGTNLWVPSAYIWGNPPNSSPMPSGSGVAIGGVGSIGVVTIGVGSQPKDENFSIGALTGFYGTGNSISSDNPNDYYNFKIDKRSNLQVNFKAGTNARLSILNTNGDEVIPINSSGSLNSASRILEPGDYKVKIARTGGDTGYDFDLSRVSLVGDIKNKGLVGWGWDDEDRLHEDGVNIYRYNKDGDRIYDGLEANKDTIVVIHGWTGSSESNRIKNLLTTVADKYKDYQVLALDWEKPAKDAPDKNSSDRDDKNGRDQKPGIPWHAARSIAPVAEWAQKTLQAMGIVADKVSLFGHSLGAYVSSEIGKYYLESTSKKVKNIVAIDPAFPGSQYDIDGNKSGDQKITEFQNAADSSLAFVTAEGEGIIDGISGDAHTANRANNSLVVKIRDLTLNISGEGHGIPVNIVANAVSKGYLKLENYLALPSGFVQNKYGDNGNYIKWTGTHEGRITATQDGNIEELAYISGSSWGIDTESKSWNWS